MLNWRKNQVATPGFVKLEEAPLSPAALHSILTRKRSVDLEDTSNAAYFYRHYRAEAREKLFYEELFESRMKHQEILQEKEKRRKKKQKGTRKAASTRNRRKSTSNCKNATASSAENGEDAKGHGHGPKDGKEGSVDSIDLALPKLPRGPWSYKLGPEYDQRPEVPSNVVNEPSFNYRIPVERLKQRHLMKDAEERRKVANWWKMPSHLIRRTDYGNMGNVKISMRSRGGSRANGSRSPSRSTSPKRRDRKSETQRNGEKGAAKGSTSGSATSKGAGSSGTETSGGTNGSGSSPSTEEELRKQELIKLYLKMKEKQKQCGKKEKKKRKGQHTEGSMRKKQKVSSGPVDVRTMLHKK